jgi:uncharacterized RDD family membrane protein YckC
MMPLIKHCPNPNCPHLEATGEAAEFRKDIELCSDCGTSLAFGNAASAVGQQAGHSDETEIARFVTIATFRDPHVAKLAKGRLESEGIEAFVAEEGLLEGMLNVRGEGAGLQVRETDARRATEILDSWPVKPESLWSVKGEKTVQENLQEPTQEASGEIKLAGRGTRLVAYLLDTFIVILILLPPMLMAIGLGFDYASARESYMWSFVSTVLSAFVFSIINWGLLNRNGQTIGKKALGIRIVGVDGSNLPASRILVRRYFPWYAMSALPQYVGMLYFFVDALFIFRTDRRCIHDFIGGTIVVKA